MEKIKEAKSTLLYALAQESLMGAETETELPPRRGRCLYRSRRSGGDEE